MATKHHAKVNLSLLEAVKETPPKNPAITGADKTYLRGLIRRGYTHDEIVAIGAKAGLKVNPQDLITNGKKVVKAV
jgi:hypothetical protein